MTQMYQAQSPTRVDLAGGTLDLWPLSVLVKEAMTVNVSLDCHTKAFFQPADQMHLKVKSPDFQFEFKFTSLKDFLASDQNEVQLLKEAFHFLKDPTQAVGSWSLESESPAGSGLGGSSSLLISILKILFDLTGQPKTEEALVEAAKNIETRVLKSSAGIQDYFSPIKSGLNAIHFGSAGFKREDLSQHLSFWKEKFLILDSEIKHHSGMNNWEILKAYIDQDCQVVEALREISEISQEVRKALVDHDLNSLKKSFLREFKARSLVSSSYINAELSVYLEKLKSVDQDISFKVCGAGGGGCLLVLTEDQATLKVQLDQAGFKVLPFAFEGPVS